MHFGTKGYEFLVFPIAELQEMAKFFREKVPVLHDVHCCFTGIGLAEFVIFF